MGKSLTEETVREIDWVDELLRSSVMETEKESEPKKFACGVYDQDPVCRSIVAEPLDGLEEIAK